MNHKTIRRKLALIIGNGDYEVGTKLKNSTNDATDMANMLKSIGFTHVEEKLNLTHLQMKHCFAEFEMSISSRDLVLFYFAGHGRQWNDENYLIPVDNADINSKNIKQRAINTQDMLNSIHNQDPYVTIFLLDCCRTYEVPNLTFQGRADISTKEYPMGLKSISPTTDMLIAFACAPGAVTDDRKDRRNGLFTDYLLKYIRISKEDIRMVLSDVTKAVIKESNWKQIPFVAVTLQHKYICLHDDISDPIETMVKKESDQSPKSQVTMRWKQNGSTVAGGHGQNGSPYTLNCPRGIFVDDQENVYIADYFNHRIVRWKSGTRLGEVIAGGNGQGPSINQLKEPTDVIVHNGTDSLLIADHGNRRVVRWPLGNVPGNEQILISNISCYGLAMDDNQCLYVTDVEKHEVRCYDMESMISKTVAGNKGMGDRCDQLNTPSYIFVDANHAIYVSDTKNHRIMKWGKGSQQGLVVAGGNGEGCTQAQLSVPRGVWVDPFGNVYVCDSGNNRIMCWNKGTTEGSYVVGGNGFGIAPNQFQSPICLSVNKNYHMYVSDYANHRIQKFLLQ